MICRRVQLREMQLLFDHCYDCNWLTFDLGVGTDRRPSPVCHDRSSSPTRPGVVSVIVAVHFRRPSLTTSTTLPLGLLIEPPDPHLALSGRAR